MCLFATVSPVLKCPTQSSHSVTSWSIDNSKVPTVVKIRVLSLLGYSLIHSTVLGHFILRFIHLNHYVPFPLPWVSVPFFQVLLKAKQKYHLHLSSCKYYSFHLGFTPLIPNGVLCLEHFFFLPHPSLVVK